MNEIASVREEWLARLTEAIDQAQRLAWQLRTNESSSADARALYGRLEEVRLELESLRRAGLPLAGPPDVAWLSLLGLASPSLESRD